MKVALYIKNTTIQSIYVTTNASLPDRIENFAKTIINFDKDLSPAFTSLAFFLNGINSGHSGITSAKLFFLEDVLGTTREF